MTSLQPLPPSLRKQWPTLLNANNILNNRKLFVCLFFFVWKSFLDVAVVKTPSLEHDARETGARNKAVPAMIPATDITRPV